MKTRHIISTALILALLICVLAFPVGAEEIDGGACGENLTWSIDS